MLKAAVLSSDNKASDNAKVTSSRPFPSNSQSSPGLHSFLHQLQTPVYPSTRNIGPSSTSSALKPTALFSLNGTASSRSSTSSQGVKRKSSSMLERTLDKQDSFSETISYPQLPLDDSATPSLYDAVYFDENDFSDDEHLQLEIQDPIVEQKSSIVVQRHALPLHPSLPPPRQHPSVDNLPNSSAPLPWSSSPVRQMEHSPQAKPEYHDAFSNPPTQPGGRPHKRRALPWLSEYKHEEPEGHAPPDRNAKATPKSRKSDDMPWDKTASAVKAEQKQFRQTHKKAEPASKQSKRGKNLGPKVGPVNLSREQLNVLHLVKEGGKSVFFTGPAGTGKSVLMREIIFHLKKKYKKVEGAVAVAASTGLAACNIGGVTLHSYAGIGLGKDAAPELVKKVRRNQKAKMRWQKTKVLIIDEVSMVDADLFDKLEQIARTIRNNGRPFGGIQLVVTGDFFQLPPVPEHGRMAKFAFDAQTWSVCIDHTIGLRQVFRQKDPEFAAMLNEMRLGKLSVESINTFRSLQRPIEYGDSIDATELFPTRSEVERANRVKMGELAGNGRTFRAHDAGAIQDTKQRDRLLENCMAPQEITLKKGAQVMLIKNIDDTLVNGSLGKIVNFMNEKTYAYYKDDEDEFEAALKDGDESISRSRKKLKGMINKELFDDTAAVWPVVRFQIADGSTRDFLCQRETWQIELPNGEVQASRAQIPLILAWALSIHKAQGQTLERVKVDLGKVFEKGQAYVALSRATSKDGLQVLRFDPRKVMAHEKVKDFYNKLYAVDEAMARADSPTDEYDKELEGDGGVSYGGY